ncbi:DUF1659 domain-containing protein [Lutibacter sp. B2]|nr:DUF1659 domain-containing protein [Lutibacter sp. B2]
MAVNVQPQEAKLKIVFSNGTDDNGKTLKRSKTYSHVKDNAENQAVYDVAAVMIGLQQKTALEVQRLDESVLEQA